MYQEEKTNILHYARLMERYHLVTLSGGNVSIRLPDNRFLVTPSAINYEDMQADDIVVVDEELNVIDGNRHPSSDMAAHLYIYKHLPGVNAVIHTHQPYATAIGLICDELPACLVTIIDANHGPVRVAPFTISSDEGMGKMAVDYAGESSAVILKHHGVIAFGNDLDEALNSAVYLEESARAYLAASAAGTVALLSDEQIAMEGAFRGNYGQNG